MDTAKPLSLSVGSRVRGASDVGTVLAVRCTRFVEVQVAWDSFPTPTWENVSKVKLDDEEHS